MSNMDLLMGIIAVLVYIFIACPLLIVPFGSDANYFESILGGMILTLVCLVIVFICISVWVCIAYFTGNVRPDTPLTDMIDWINAI